MVLEESLIFPHTTFANTQQLFEFLSKVLLEKKYVNDSFLELLCAREKEYPTGLQTPVCGIAIPHTESSAILEERLPIITLEKPVEFRSMEDTSKIEVHMVFMLLIREGKSHISMLEKLFSLFGCEDKVAYLQKETNSRNIIEFLQKEGIY